MSEKLMTKQETAEMKRHGSRKQQERAVSVQIGRIADKLIKRAQEANIPALSHNRQGFPNSYTTLDQSDSEESSYSTLRHEGQGTLGHPDSSRWFIVSPGEATSLIATSKKKKNILGRQKIKQQVEIFQPTGEILTQRTVIDPTGKEKPKGGRYSNGTETPLSAEDVVARTAPALENLRDSVNKATTNNEPEQKVA